MKRTLFFSLITVLLVGMAVAIYAAKGEGRHFPPAGIDLVTHELQVGIYTIADDGTDGERLETLKFRGRMLLERGDPYTNADKRRQIDFLVKEWEAFAWSDVLDTLVTYRLTEGVQQEMSSITAQQETSDYPAEFSFHVGFSATVFGQEAIIPPPGGNPEEEGFFEVPPSGNRRTSPTIYGFETVRIEFDHPQHGHLRFVPLMCNDSSGETLIAFEPESAARDKRLMNT
jgi:hypothetical protein